jgi:8-oxo-dGTP pyrophosphatase MutT (NUDIX family)
MITCTAFLGGTKDILKDKLKFRPAVYAIIPRNDKVLLVSTIRTKKLYLPGGGVDIGETLHEALKREVREETGIEIEVGEMVHFKEDFFYYDPGDEAYHSLLFFFAAHPKTFTLAEDDQIDDGEIEKPGWVAWQNLQPDDFHTHGETIVQILHSM